MVGHQHVRMNGAAPIASRVFEPMEVAVVVLLGEKARLAVDAALNDVQRNFRELETRAARHGY